jgi:hypothetical protein
VIGAVDISSMDPLEMDTATVTWDTTGYSLSAIGCASTYYRIYVVLDPNNTITETYETEDPNASYPFWDFNTGQKYTYTGIDPGQNNEGYGLATIVQPNPGGTCEEAFLKPDTRMKKNSAAVVSGKGKIETDEASVKVGKPTQLRIGVFSNARHNGASHLLVLDRYPGRPDRLIADHLIPTGNPEGHSAWVTWVPQEQGPHEIVAVVLEKTTDPKRGNNTDTLAVLVVDQPRACDSAPSLTAIIGPKDNKEVKKPRVRLRWQAAACAAGYDVVVRRARRDGAVVLQKEQLLGTEFKTPKLERGTLYEWQVRACNLAGCGAWSDPAQFRVKQE